MVSLGSFNSNGKVLQVYNLGKAGALKIGNILCHYEDKTDLAEGTTDAKNLVESFQKGICKVTAYDLAKLSVTHGDNCLSFNNFLVFFERNPVDPTQLLPVSQVSITLHVREIVLEQPYLSLKVRKHDTFTLRFSTKTQFLIRRLQMYFKRCIFKVRCHRRHMLLLACMITHPRINASSKESSDASITLAAMFNDPFGGIMRQFIAPLVVA
jgi:hypothetical protein